MDVSLPRDGQSGPADTHTEVLERSAAGSLADPDAYTQVIPGAPVIAPGGSAGADRDPVVPPVEGSRPVIAPQPLVSRPVAAEMGVYVGAGLALAAVLVPVLGGWDSWEPALRWAFIGLGSLALLTLGLFIRLPWRRRAGDQRRRAVSALLTASVAWCAVGVWSALGPAGGDAPGSPGAASVALGVALSAVVVNLIARTPLSETLLLAALAWSAWAAVPPGPGTWAFLVGAGTVWAVLGMRWARGRRIAVVAGAGLALVASVGMASGPWGWPTRAALAVLAVAGLGAFVRGRANAWLALGAAASTALAASVAGEVVQPAIALLAGGLATMAVSGIALRSAGGS